MINTLCEENPEMTMEAFAGMTSQAIGIGKVSMHRI
jgi:hypothetical protein